MSEIEKIKQNPVLGKIDGLLKNQSGGCIQGYQQTHVRALASFSNGRATVQELDVDSAVPVHHHDRLVQSLPRIREGAVHEVVVGPGIVVGVEHVGPYEDLGLRVDRPDGGDAAAQRAAPSVAAQS